MTTNGGPEGARNAPRETNAKRSTGGSGAIDSSGHSGVRPQASTSASLESALRNASISRPLDPASREHGGDGPKDHISPWPVNSNPNEHHIRSNRISAANLILKTYVLTAAASGISFLAIPSLSMGLAITTIAKALTWSVFGVIALRNVLGSYASKNKPFVDDRIKLAMRIPLSQNGVKDIAILLDKAAEYLADPQNGIRTDLGYGISTWKDRKLFARTPDSSFMFDYYQIRGLSEQAQEIVRIYEANDGNSTLPIHAAWRNLQDGLAKIPTGIGMDMWKRKNINFGMIARLLGL